MLKIIIDAMGGDNAPEEIVKGAVQSLEKSDKFSLILTGDEQKINAELAKYKYDATRIEIMHCTDVIDNNDVPTKAIRTKTDSSLVVAFDRLKKDPEVGALITAGSTGATLAGGIFMVGRIKGISRPALCPALPNVRGTQTLLCDCGANLECKPMNFAHFAIMASAYAKAAFGIENPKVGLLNNGAEEHKGDEVHQAAYKLLSKMDCINFGGNVEGREIMYSDFDVIVSDGFSGNVGLKAIEGCGKTVADVLKKAAYKNIFSMLGALCAKGVIDELKSMLDYHKYGGSVFLGLKKIVVKSHGSSKAKTICASILKAADAHENNLVKTIEDMLSTVDLQAVEAACRAENEH
ncbi:MAG: phosphate acyltransferase PlsX [Clostridia bacterium]|nr:phosphate acyltransferase PlsX [Clostridia bacterium]